MRAAHSGPGEKDTATSLMEVEARQGGPARDSPFLQPRRVGLSLFTEFPYNLLPDCQTTQDITFSIRLRTSPVSKDRYLFTSESVSMGHPDKVADQISDAILDHCLAADPTSRVACETMVTTDLAIVAGEITTNADLSRATVDRIVRDVIREIGYTDPNIGFAADTCQVICKLHSQSPNISQGVDVGGAGDQGMMFGFACDETKSLMPLPIFLAHRLVENHATMRKNGLLPFVRPDAKSQVTVEYNADGTPNRIHTIVLSTQHDETVMGTKTGKPYFTDEARKIIRDKLIRPSLEAERKDLIKGDLVMVIPGDKLP